MNLCKISSLLVLLFMAIVSFAPGICYSEEGGSSNDSIVELDIKMHPQHTPVWCWAATIAMVSEYLNSFPLEDCMVLAEYDMRLNGYGLCCMNPAMCNRPGGLDEMRNILGQIFLLQGVHLESTVSFDRIRSEIDSGRPLIVGLRTQQSGHVVVISGYGPGNRVVILDPMHGRYVVDYEVLKANWTYGVWTDTFTFSTGRSEDPTCQILPEVVVVPSPCPPYGYGMCPTPMTRYRIVCEPHDD